MKHKTRNKFRVCCDQVDKWVGGKLSNLFALSPSSTSCTLALNIRNCHSLAFAKFFLLLFPALVVLVRSLMNSRQGRFLLSYTPSSHQQMAKIASVWGNLNISPFPPHKSSTESTQVRTDTTLCG